jgi:hypothetical protein
MAVVVVPALQLFGDGLPNVCFRTGRPTRERIPVTFATVRVPRLVGLLMVVASPFFGGIAYLLLRRTAFGTLAVTPDVIRERRRALWIGVAIALVGTVTLVIGIAATNAASITAGAVGALLVGPVSGWALRRRTLPRAYVYDEGGRRVVRLDGVHPAFAAAFTDGTLASPLDRQAAAGIRGS